MTPLRVSTTLVPSLRREETVHRQLKAHPALSDAASPADRTSDRHADRFLFFDLI